MGKEKPVMQQGGSAAAAASCCLLLLCVVAKGSSELSHHHLFCMPSSMSRHGVTCQKVPPPPSAKNDQCECSVCSPRCSPLETVPPLREIRAAQGATCAGRCVSNRHKNRSPRKQATCFTFICFASGARHARVAGCESHIGGVGNPEGSAAALAFIFPLAIR